VTGQPGPGELAALRAEVAKIGTELGQTIMHTDETESELLLQVVALEEILFARWPRSVLLRARWRRDVRASVRDAPGRGFAERRLEALGSGWITRPGSRWYAPGKGRNAG
jgi:hypothetical protein